MIVHPRAELFVWPDAFLQGVYSMYHNYLIWAFIGVVIIDIITGFVKGFVTKKIDSTVGLAGLTKHLLVIFVTMIIYPFLDATEFDEIADIWVMFYIVSYLLSIVENWGQIGLPLPDVVKEYIKKLGNTKETKK
jgi:toxin secretion/phage lysis holin